MGLCGMKNYGANCYLNSGLHIIERCDIFISWLKSNNYDNYDKKDFPFLYLIKNMLEEIYKTKIVDPKYFIKIFSEKNTDFQM